MRVSRHELQTIELVWVAFHCTGKQETAYAQMGYETQIAISVNFACELSDLIFAFKWALHNAKMNVKIQANNFNFLVSIFTYGVK